MPRLRRMRGAGKGVEGDGLPLARFLREEAERIARFAARIATSNLPVGGTGARRRLRTLYQEQIEELARLLDTYGEDGPRLYGESQRRFATKRLTQGARMTEVMEERAIVHDAILEVGIARGLELSVETVSLLTASFAEAAAQIGDVYLTFQRAESAGFREEALLETIVGHLDEAILVVERDGMVSFVTPAIERVLGYPPRVFVGSYFDSKRGFIAQIDPRDRFGVPIDADDLPHQVALRTGKPVRRDVVVARRADGTEAVLEVGADPVRDEEGDLRGVVMTMRDRTENFEKSRALEEAYRERRQMHARLLSRSQLEAAGSLARSTAHALNNQLQVITLRLRKLEEVEDAADEAAGIERAVREITTLVGRLQELGTAAPTGEAVPTDATSIVEQALALTRPEFDGRQVEVH
ncbi:MAG TPA: PAS domain-containing protein, partial [Vulgatibacter sp.]